MFSLFYSVTFVLRGNPNVSMWNIHLISDLREGNWNSVRTRNQNGCC